MVIAKRRGQRAKSLSAIKTHFNAIRATYLIMLTRGSCSRWTIKKTVVNILGDSEIIFLWKPGYWKQYSDVTIAI